VLNDGNNPCFWFASHQINEIVPETSVQSGMYSRGCYQKNKLICKMKNDGLEDGD